jgi:hypothetical protein
VPPTRWYRCLFGADSVYTLIGEREFDGMAAMEATDRQLAASEAWRELDDAPGFHAVFLSTRYEIYQVMS